jgi:hypothetical protein
MEFGPFTGNIAWIAAVWEVLEVSGERKERWPYLRAALSSTINYTDFHYTANSQDRIAISV